MEDKEYLERHFFDRFAENYKNLPFGTVIKSESPDFLIKTDNETIGIEITRIINTRNPGETFSPQERNAVEQKI
jgi:hypothetical protein